MKADAALISGRVIDETGMTPEVLARHKDEVQRPGAHLRAGKAAA